MNAINVLFSQSETENPYGFYEKMLVENPVYWDEKNNIWAIYSFHECQFVLNNNSCEIPKIDTDYLNEKAKIIVENLVRLNNPPFHKEARNSTNRLFEKLLSVDIDESLTFLINDFNFTESFDFVEKVAKKLPVLTILKGFEFDKTAIDYILPRIEILVKLMLPKKSQVQIDEINNVIEIIYKLVENKIEVLKLSNNELEEKIYISNLIGLLIQSYDAGRGLISNSFLELFLNKNEKNFKQENLKNFVVELTRYNSPIQNTRRKLTDDIVIRNQILKKESVVLLVLASANRDIEKFENPNIFDINRINNNENLTFGNGIHSCLAKYFSIDLTVNTLRFFINKYNNIKIQNEQIEYEPMINARLPKRILITMTNRNQN